MQRFKAQSELCGDVKSLTETIKPRENGATKWMDTYNSQVEALQNSVKAFQDRISESLKSVGLKNPEVIYCPAMRQRVA